MKRILSAILAVFILFSLPACQNKKPDNSDKTIHYFLGSEPLTLDPQAASDSAALTAIGAIYEGLARLDSSGAAIPGVAESWSASGGNTVFTFTLRSDAKWSDDAGTPVTAQDFVFGFRRALSPSTHSALCRPMFCIKNAEKVNSGELPPSQLGVTAKDDHTLVVELNYSYENFPALTATAPFMPCNEKFFNGTYGKYGLEYQYILSNGPFVINGKYGWEHNKELKLARSDSYRGGEKPLPAMLDFSMDSEETNVSDPVAALTNSTVDAISIPESLVDKAKKAELSVTSYQNITWGICFNTSDEVMKNLNLRRGLLTSLPRDTLLSYLPEKAQAADNIIGPQTRLMGKSYRELAGGSIPYQKEIGSSGALLQAGLKELGKTGFPAVTVLCPDDENAKRMVNEMLAVWNQKTGSYFSMEPLAPDELAKRVTEGRYQIALYGISPGQDGALLSLFLSDNNKNPAHLKSDEFDGLIQKAEQSGEKEAAANYAKAERYLNDKCVFYPVYYKNSYFACAKGVTGIVFRPDSAQVDFLHAGKLS